MDSFCDVAFDCVHIFGDDCLKVDFCEDCEYYLKCASCTNLFVCDLSPFFGLSPESPDLDKMK